MDCIILPGVSVILLTPAPVIQYYIVLQTVDICVKLLCMQFGAALTHWGKSYNLKLAAVDSSVSYLLLHTCEDKAWSILSACGWKRYHDSLKQKIQQSVSIFYIDKTKEHVAVSHPACSNICHNYSLAPWESENKPNQQWIQCSMHVVRSHLFHGFQTSLTGCVVDGEKTFLDLRQKRVNKFKQKILYCAICNTYVLWFMSSVIKINSTELYQTKIKIPLAMSSE